MIQEDILKRCQDALTTRGIPIEGLNVEGRDVVLSGLPKSEITNSRTRSVIAELSGVRDVRTNVLREMQTGAKDLAPATSAQQQALQDRIDRLLDNQRIRFKAESAILTPGSEKVLDEVSQYLSQAPSLRCEIWGYDNEPQDAQPGGVSALRRALSTEDYLINKGVAEWRLSTHASQTGEGAEGRRRDRTIDLVVKAR